MCVYYYNVDDVSVACSLQGVAVFRGTTSSCPMKREICRRR